MKKSIANKLKKIKCVVLDVDGTLTNGEIIIDGDGKELKIFDVQDGYGVVLLRRAGIKVAIISARRCTAVTVRAKDLCVDKIYQNARPKTAYFDRLLKLWKLKDDQALFMGDDLPDFGLLKRVGCAVTVPNAVNEIKRIAHYVTKNEGGNGAVREVVEMLLKSQNKWKATLKRETK